MRVMNAVEEVQKRDYDLNDPDVVISAKNVSKKFCRRLQRSMFYGILDLTKNLVGVRPDSTSLHKDEFWAVNDVSFELRRGEVLGLIGPNGSGKTTLLRLLAGIMPPDRGQISVRGRVGALISLGAGFHPHMTGRENIYINGTILGMERAEIDRKFQSIVDFAEIGEFIDAPVATYSSGMTVRLGFSIASSVEPDLLLLDEVLAVGDAGFRAKCYDRVYGMLERSAVIFVSHNMVHVNRMCTQIMLMHRGIATFYDKAGLGIRKYYEISMPRETDGGMSHGTGQVCVENLEIVGKNGELRTGDPADVSFDIKMAKDIASVSVQVHILTREKLPCAHVSSEPGSIRNSGKRCRLNFHCPQLPLVADDYFLSITVLNEELLQLLLWQHGILRFAVQGKDEFLGTPIQLQGTWKMGIADS